MTYLCYSVYNVMAINGKSYYVEGIIILTLYFSEFQLTADGQSGDRTLHVPRAVDPELISESEAVLTHGLLTVESNV